MEETKEELEIDASVLLKYLGKHWKIVASGLLCGILLAGIYSFVWCTPLYRSSAMIYVREMSSTASLQDLQMEEELMSDYAILLTSRPVLEKVIDTLNLKMDSNTLKSKISVSGKNDTRILEISVLDVTPQQACEIAVELTEQGMVVIEQVSGQEPFLVEPAIEEMASVKPEYARNFALGAVLGVSFSISTLTILFILDDRLKGADDIEKYVGHPVICTIFEKKRNDSECGIPGIKEKLQFLSIRLLEMEEKQIIEVVSAVHGEGKTTLCNMLGEVLREFDKKVLILDGNIKGYSRSLGEFESILEKAKEKYDYVLVDTPPACERADAFLVAQVCDGILIIVRDWWVKRTSVYNLKREFTNRKKVIGIVLNRERLQ